MADEDKKTKEKPDKATESTAKNKAESKKNQPVAAPADALSMTPEELGQTMASAEQTGENVKVEDKRRFGKLRRFFKKVNLYLMIFIILLVVAAAIAVVTWLYSQKQPPEAVIGSQLLSQEALDDLANSEASVGNNRQRLTIKGDTTIDGQTLMRSNLDVAGNIQSSAEIRGSDLTVSGTSNLSNTQIDRLQVSANLDANGDITISRNLSVAGSSTFNGPITAGQITASQLVMSGNARLEIPNHLSFTGPAPELNINRSVLGNGSTASLNGSDTSGLIRMNSGTGTSGGCMVTVNFRTGFTDTPRVIVSPVDAAAGNLNFYVTRNNNNFSICTNNAPAVHSGFGFDYFVAG